MLLMLLWALLWGGECAEGWVGQDQGHKKSQTLVPGYWLKVEKTVTAQRGLCVLVPCSFSYPQEGYTESIPAHGYWFTHPANTDSDFPVATNNQFREVASWTQGRFQLVGSLRDRSCSLLITDVQEGDRRSYFFRFERGDSVKFNFWRNQFYLNVTALTQKPAVYVPELLDPGRQVTAICVFDFYWEQCEAPTFSWTGAALSSQETNVTTAHVSVLTLTPRQQDHDTTLTCRVDFPRRGVGIENSVLLNVAYAPKVPVISISSDKESVLELQGDSPSWQAQKGQFLRLLCAADSRPPATLIWALEDRALSQSHPSGSGGLELVLPGVQPGDAGRYSCRAENRLGFQSRTLKLSVNYAPENLTVTVSGANGTVLENLRNGAILPVLEGQSLRLLCVTHSNPPALLSWARGGQLWSPSQPSDSGVLELPRIQLEHEGEYICNAQNLLGSLSVSLNLSVHRAGKTGLTSKGFSAGALLGAGVAALVLCLVLFAVKALREARTHAEAGAQAEAQAGTETGRARVTRRSTILDYVNVVPAARGLAGNRKAKPSSPSRAPPAGANSPELKSPPPAPGPRNSQEEIHYAALSFPRLRPQETQQPNDTSSEYAEIRFH